MALETHDVFNSAVRVGGIVRAADHPNAAVVWDLGHPHRAGESVAEAWAAIGPFVVHVHVKDIVRTDDEREWESVLAGQGEVPIADMLSVLRAAGYDGLPVYRVGAAGCPHRRRTQGRPGAARRLSAGDSGRRLARKLAQDSPQRSLVAWQNRAHVEPHVTVAHAGDNRRIRAAQPRGQRLPTARDTNREAGQHLPREVSLRRPPRPTPRRRRRPRRGRAGARAPADRPAARRSSARRERCSRLRPAGSGPAWPGALPA